MTDALSDRGAEALYLRRLLSDVPEIPVAREAVLEGTLAMASYGSTDRRLVRC